MVKIFITDKITAFLSFILAQKSIYFIGGQTKNENEQ